MTIDKRYWDANAFLAWLKPEPDKKDACRGVLENAQNGQILIVTSALTLTEVIKLKKKAPIGKDHAELIKKFFKNEFISVRNVDRYIAELARELIWEYSFLKPKDSIHVATALRYKLRIIDTFDAALISLDGKLGNPPLRIGIPNVAYQAKLPFHEKDGE